MMIQALIVLAILILIAVIAIIVLLLLKNKLKNQEGFSKENIKEITEEITREIKSQTGQVKLELVENNNLKNLENIKNLNENFITLRKEFDQKIKQIDELVKKEEKSIIESNAKFYQDYLDNAFANLTVNNNKKLDEKNKDLNDNFSNMRKEVDLKIKNLIETNDRKLKQINELILEKIQKIKEDIDKQLKVELENKLKTHFENVEKDMTQLSKNIVEFQTLQNDVSKLTRIFHGVKQRGNFGELSLRNIFENTMSKDLWAEQFIIPGDKSNSPVDFVVKISDFDSELGHKYLPIDSKFPTKELEDYLALDDVQKQADKRKEILKNFNNKAKDISKKYINSKYTTEYAFMYLPSEALYSFVISDSQFVYNLYEKYNVIVVSPSNIMPYLQSALNQKMSERITKNINDLYEVFKYIKKHYSKTLELINKSKTSADKIIKNLDSASQQIALSNKKLDLPKIERKVETIKSIKEELAHKKLQEDIEAIELDEEVEISTNDEDETEIE